MLFASSSAFAASYIVTSDRETVRRADVIVIASALLSYPQEADNGSIETVTVISIEEVLKGTVSTPTIEVHEPGGRLGKRVKLVFGAPTFREGERLLLFLKNIGPDQWATSDFALGKFSFDSDDAGGKLLVRQESDIHGWDVDMKEHHEGRRSAEKFLEFVRTEAKGGMGRRDYAVAKHPLAVHSLTLMPQILTASTSPKSYTAPDDPTNGYRWGVFPSAVNYTYSGASSNQAAATAAVNGAFASWNNDTGSNVNLVNAGADPGPGAPQGWLGIPDGRNSIRFEVDLSSAGFAPISCSANSYGGVLGYAGINATSGTNALSGETFYSITEGDADMNVGLLACTYMINKGDLISAVTHEVGHTIGFRHSDQNRATNGACVPSATMECETLNAIMKAFIATNLNGALQPWDINAVRAVYPGGSAPAAPVINALASSSTTVAITWAAISGATSYDVFRRSAGTGFVLAVNTASAGYTDTVASNSANLYKVVAKNAGGSSPDSNINLATTVIYTDDPLVATATTIKAIHLTQLRTAADAVRALAGMGAGFYTDPTPTGLTVKSAHITQLRTNLDTALSSLSLGSGGYTNSAAAGTVVRALDFQEIRNRMK